MEFKLKLGIAKLLEFSKSYKKFKMGCRDLRLMVENHLNIGTSEVVGNKFECRLLSCELFESDFSLS